MSTQPEGGGAGHTVQMTIAPMPLPALPTPLTGPLVELVALWDHLVEPVPDGGGDGDFEDWVEMAYRLHSTVTAFGAAHVRLRFAGTRIATTPAGGPRLTLPTSGPIRHPDRYVDALTGLEAAGPLPELPDVGIVLGAHAAEYSPSSARASDYMTLRTFAAHAGRRVELADIATGDDRDAERVIERFRADGVGRIYAKMRESKILNVIVEDHATLQGSVGEDAVWTLIHHGGTQNSILIQEWIPMRFEYRIFVAGGLPVTGAGALVERTPLDNTGAPFDPFVREHRRDGAPDYGGTPVERPDLAATYLKFAQRVTAELRAEDPTLSEYVLDVALDQHGAPLIVELNACENAGFFACQPHLFAAARARHLPGTARPLPRSVIPAGPLVLLESL